MVNYTKIQLEKTTAEELKQEIQLVEKESARLRKYADMIIKAYAKKTGGRQGKLLCLLPGDLDAFLANEVNEDPSIAKVEIVRQALRGTPRYKKFISEVKDNNGTTTTNPNTEIRN